MAKLKNKKHELFCREYLIDLNATQAAIRAEYSKNTAAEQSSRLLTNVNIQDRIAELMAEREKRTDITADKVLEEYAKIGFADIKSFVEFKTAKAIVGTDENGEDVIDWRINVAVKDSEEVDGSLISEVSISKDGTFKFKLHDKLNALDKLGRHLGIFNDKNNAPDNTAINDGIIAIADLLRNPRANRELPTEPTTDTTTKGCDIN